VKTTGTVYLVGAGPGASDLLTVRSVRLLGEADIVFHDALGKKIPVGKRSGRHSTVQRFINKRLADAAREHRVVVRLKGGDPMLFGRAHEEIDYLQKHGIPVQVVPGVTAALAASADLGISLTRRGTARSVTFVTPRVGRGERDSSWIAAVIAADTAAIYMGAGEAQAIAAALIAAGKPRSTPVAVLENASLPDRVSRFGTLEQLPQLVGGVEGQGDPTRPTLILLGEVYAEAVAQALERCIPALKAAQL
jgi:uroporphyrin-III C-methyltransferase